MGPLLLVVRDLPMVGSSRRGSTLVLVTPLTLLEGGLEVSSLACVREGWVERLFLVLGVLSKKTSTRICPPTPQSTVHRKLEGPQ